ncbi:MAG: hypothetical protein AAFX99_13460 [Myxococcota bacterium]
MSLEQQSSLCLWVLGGLGLAVVLGLGGCAAQGPAAMQPNMDSSTAPGIDSDRQSLEREVDALMEEIAAQRASLLKTGTASDPSPPPEPSQPSNPNEPSETGRTPAHPEIKTKPTPSDASPPTSDRQRCDTVASAICSSTERICAIAARHPAETYFASRCADASDACTEAQAMCAVY